MVDSSLDQAECNAHKMNAVYRKACFALRDSITDNAALIIRQYPELGFFHLNSLSKQEI